MKMCFEGMEENGSDGLDKFIASEKGKFFTDIDCMCISGQLDIVGSSETADIPQRQLLARHEDALLDLRSEGHQLLRDPSLWAGPRPPFWSVWRFST